MATYITTIFGILIMESMIMNFHDVARFNLILTRLTEEHVNLINAVRELIYSVIIIILYWVFPKGPAHHAANNSSDQTNKDTES